MDPDKKRQIQQTDEQFQQRISKYNLSFKKIMPIVLVCVIVDMLGYMMVMPLLPFYAQSFGASDFTIGIITALNAVTSLIAGPVWGRLSDKYGRKPILLVSEAGTLLSFLLLAVSGSTWMLMFSRVVDGLFGGQIPVINATISDVTSPETRAERMAFMSVAMTFGSIVGPMIGGYLGALNIVYPAYAACLMSLVAIAMTVAIFTETMPPERKADIKLRKASNGAAPEGIRFTRTLKLRLSQAFFMTLVFGMIFSSMSLILNQRYGASTSSIGNIMAAMGVCTFVFGAILMRRVKELLGESRMLVLGVSLLTCAYFISYWLPTLNSFYIFIVVFGAGSNFARPIVRSNLSRAVDEDQQGLISGYSTTVESLARTIAPLISTGWLQLGGLAIGALAVNEFGMISATGVVVGLVFMTLVLLDVRQSRGDAGGAVP